MVKNKKRSVSFWGALKVLTLASTTAMCLSPASYLPTNSSPSFQTMNRTLLDADVIPFPMVWHPLDMDGEWPPIDMNGVTNVEKWMRKINNESMEAKVADLLKDPETIDCSIIDTLEVAYPGKESIHPDWIDVQMTLVDGKTFPNGERGVHGETSLWKWQRIGEIDNLIIPTIDLKSRQTIDQWIDSENGKQLSEKITDLIKAEDISVFINAASDLRIVQHDNQAHVRLTLNDGYKFVDAYDVTREWNISFANDTKLIQKPIFKKSINLGKKTDLSSWVTNENYKSISEKITDLFENKGDLNKRNVDSIKLSLNRNGNADVSVLLKAGYKFDDDKNNQRLKNQISLTNPATILQNPVFNFAEIDLGNTQTVSQWLARENNESFNNKIDHLFVEATGLTNENASIDIQEALNNGAMITVTLRSGYVFRDGTDSKTKTIYLLNPAVIVKPTHTGLIVGSSVGIIILTVAIFTLIAVWTSRKQQEVNKLNFRLRESELQRKLAVNKSAIGEKNIALLPSHQNNKDAKNNVNLQKSKPVVQTKLSSLPNTRTPASQRTNLPTKKTGYSKITKSNSH